MFCSGLDLNALQSPDGLGLGGTTMCLLLPSLFGARAEFNCEADLESWVTPGAVRRPKGLVDIWADEDISQGRVHKTAHEQK